MIVVLAQIPQSSQPSSGQIVLGVGEILIGSAVLAATVAIGSIKWFVSRSIENFDKKQAEFDKALAEQRAKDNELEKKILECRIAHKDNFVENEDFQRWMNRLVSQLERHDEKLDVLTSRLDTYLGGK